MTFVGDTLCGRHPRRHARAVAVACGGRSLTHGDLIEDIARIEVALDRHFPPRARVGISADTPFDAIRLVLAVARSGRVALVADPAQTGFSRASLEQALSLRFRSLADLDGAAALPGVGTTRPDADDPFYIGLTSGSTGKAKAFQRSHGSWLTSFDACEAAFGLTGDDRIAVPGSLSHSLHLFGAVHAVHLGARLDLADRFRPRGVLEQMIGAGTTVLYATPTQLDLLVRAARAAGVRLPEVRRVLISGSKWHGSGDAVADVFPAARFHEFYGTSETSFIATRDDDDPPASVGRPFPGVAVEIRDEAGNRLPAGAVGLIHVSSAMLFDRYVYGDDPDTRRDGDWLSVGDCGHLDEDGRLYLQGRRSRMLVSAGVNVFAEEVEAVLLSHACVAGCAVFGRPDPLRGQRIVAAIRASEAASGVTPEALRQHCLAHLDPIKVPRAFHMLEDWPLTAGGKADLVALAKRVERLEAGT